MTVHERQLYRASAEVVEMLPLLLRQVRAERRITMTDLERVTGVSRATQHRIESGMPCSTATAVKLLRWIAS